MVHKDSALCFYVAARPSTADNHALVCAVYRALLISVPWQRGVHQSMPFMAFALTGISAGCLGLILPETLNRPIAETLEELQNPPYQRILEKEVHMCI